MLKDQMKPPTTVKHLKANREHKQDSTCTVTDRAVPKAKPNESQSSAVSFSDLYRVVEPLEPL
eukprot:5831206-Prymnesium_polylepis.1